jgi:hypothetical protein
MARNTEKEFFTGPMGLNITESSMTTTSMARESINGLMEENMKGNG